MLYQSRTQRPRALPVPVPTGVYTTSDCDDVGYGKGRKSDPPTTESIARRVLQLKWQIKKRSPRLRFQCCINPERNALRALPVPVPTGVYTTSYCDDVGYGKGRKSDPPTTESIARRVLQLKWQIKKRSAGLRFQCCINPERNALRALPVPVPTGVYTTSYCDDVEYWKSDEPFLRSQPREGKSRIMR